MKKSIATRDRAIVLAVRATIQLRSCPVPKRRPTVVVIDFSRHVYGFDKFIVEQFYFEHTADLG